MTEQTELNFGQPRRRVRSYHATTPMTPAGLTEAVAVAEGQDDAILAVFRRFPASPLSPSRVHALMVAEGRSVLLTSVRRSINTLTNAGQLVRADLIAGPWGRNEWSHRINNGS